jgi:DNA polymerase-3 subunit alpha
MNLAFKYPTIYWNCACLVSDSGGTEIDEDDIHPDQEEYYEDNTNEAYDLSMEEFVDDVEDEEDDEDDDNTVVAAEAKKKAKSKVTNYDKIAKALGQIQSAGVTISPPDINKSGLTFKPIPDEDKIIYGIKGITRIGDDLIKDIMAGRPYTSLKDFTNRVKVNKLQMVNLIKSGAFDCFGDRRDVMREYILSVSDQKKRLTLQNMAMLIETSMLPPQLQHEVKVFNFNKYLKKNKDGADYIVDQIAYNFYEQFYDCDLLFIVDDQWHIKQTEWDKIYKKAMEPVRMYLKEHNIRLLTELNDRLYMETYYKYASGSISKWEMDSICYYSHEHELAKLNNAVYEIANFHTMPEEPMIERTFPSKDGKTIPIYKTFRFAGTVLGKDKNKGLVTLLTTTGVVSVRIFKAQFTEYDKQISRKNPDGTKTVIEKSWFTRGSKLILNGFRRGNDLVLKKYKNTPYPVIGLITKITDDGLMEYKTEREEA